ncbi:hypothetical protein CPB83DRAFT_843361 [Crepidotus variabilis]|uniref:Uncharacterized protein n=1 Tax=Crepidotus variabilis TaxID=179855 RepID=A0A9P6ES08_9AGAR|nr:hypothetical protein CPB83DRAFT_843361 [Crepidotus variabilis]
MASLVNPAKGIFSEVVDSEISSLDHASGQVQPNDVLTVVREPKKAVESEVEVTVDDSPSPLTTCSTHVNVSTPFTTNSTKFEYPFPVSGTHAPTDIISHPSHPFIWPSLDNGGSPSGAYLASSVSPTTPTGQRTFPTFKIKLPLFPTPPTLIEKQSNFGLLGRRDAARVMSEVQSSVDPRGPSSKEDCSKRIKFMTQSHSVHNLFSLGRFDFLISGGILSVGDSAFWLFPQRGLLDYVQT